MKLLTLALILAPSIALADFVSPNDYKDYTCDELRSDYYDIGDSMLDNLSESLDYDYRSSRRFELDQQYKKLKAHQGAIEKAAKRIECNLKQPAQTAEA